MQRTVEVHSLFTDFDVSLFQAGKHYKLYEKFGSHTLMRDGQAGTYFAVWAPNAESVAVVGNFNGWNPYSHALYVRWDGSGIWEGFIPGIGVGELYKYRMQSYQGEILEKGDPFALQWEQSPGTASLVSTTWYEWKDEDWMRVRHEHNGLNKPIAVYEMHLGSWIRSPDNPTQLLDYRGVADKLVPYIKETGFTHVELMPVMEHPYYPSWGYQITGYFAASSRYGSPQDLMYLIEQLHRNGIGVILDWVPSHFPGDVHGLHRFDGTHLYEHQDPRQGYHPDWGSYIFNYGRNEVRSFLISNAIFWLERYHADGLRVDAVASMLYLDYSRKEGEWIPNEYGGRENLQAIGFLKELNEAVYAAFPDVQTIAEESTSWPGVSRPVYSGGLGFGMKWMMGWMHDTLQYFSRDPLFRHHHHGQLTFSLLYSFHENFMLPLSHDEVVHGKGSMVYKMPGDDWQRFANLRTLYLYMYTHPGTKLLFMGCEFGQTAEWNFNQSLDWHLMQYEPHKGVFELLKSLNHLYRQEPALYEHSFSAEGFEWIEGGDAYHGVLAYLRKGVDRENDLLIIINLTPVVRYFYRCGLPSQGEWTVVLNSDDRHYYGSGIEQPPVQAEPVHWMNQNWSAQLTLPPLAGLVLKRRPEKPNDEKNVQRLKRRPRDTSTVPTVKADKSPKGRRTKKDSGNEA
ncbi:1,4-alpha-glucan branching protein GlgB [Parapedobacter sp. ISTM3]|uniref:1,4-alpha-glucan branching enzyme GlgB n=1 Tax=Parapedobacter luteus TaxID=623280 RepID=A0A1T5E070_9SPHI|nr:MULTISPECIES: 1,4-alpha-glucan branching protein GlgB [Parapedobacter]MBK1442696.1 1,4-alpha-glucan branching protein GlgB [Parapedobacter sp. ISTM3]SKB77355.1 1,4-alpha-glucan branching enzyme [Parapedobacter luteus]